MSILTSFIAKTAGFLGQRRSSVIGIWLHLLAAAAGCVSMPFYGSALASEVKQAARIVQSTPSPLRPPNSSQLAKVNAKSSAQKPVDASSKSAVLDSLLKGRDARAAVAEGLSHQVHTTALAHESPDGAFYNYAESLRVLYASLQSLSTAWSAPLIRLNRVRLEQAILAVRTRRPLVDKRLSDVSTRLNAPAIPGIARLRWKARRATLSDRLAWIDEALQRATTELAKTPADQAPALGDLAQVLEDENRAAAPATYGAATLPLFRPRLATRDTAMSPSVVPAYANAQSEDIPVAADYAASPDAPLSDMVLAQAQSLGNDYTRIFDFVRSQVRTQWYAGAQKGADTTLRTLSGNDVDQACLLIALLRASGAAARYVRGVVDVPSADLSMMLGVREDQVGAALAAAGVANRPIISAGRISAFAVEHTFVDAYLPFSNYRGTAADLGGYAWIPLAPAIKPHVFTPATGALAIANISLDEFLQHVLSRVQDQLPLDLLRSQIGDALSALSPPLLYGDQLSRLSVSATPIELLPASLPVETELITAESAELPDTQRQHARIIVRSGSAETDPIILDRRLVLDQVIDRRLTIAYQPASIDDGKIADQNGGLGAVPPYLIHLRPVLMVSGLPSAAGIGEVEGGAAHRIEITLDSPAGSVSLAQILTAGGIAAIVVDAQDNAPPLQSDAVVLPGDGESSAARVLANFGTRYLSDWDAADDELARLVGVGVMRPFPSVALVLNQYRVDRIGGVADALVWRGVALDAALRPVEPFGQTTNAAAPDDWLRLAALEGSALEHSLFESQWAVDSISADKGLALAVANGNAPLTLMSTADLGLLRQPQPVMDAVANWLTRGYFVEIPRDPIAYEDWIGAIWRVYSASNGESGYFIAGTLAGGSTAMPPQLWYFQDLAELLANPYAESPDQDPLAGVALSIDASAQYQDGVVGTTLEKPLRAIVVDAAGRPVIGAQIKFTVTVGNAKLIGADGTESGEAIYTSDRSGAVSASVRLGAAQGTQGNYRLEVGKTYPQWVGESRIEVSAQASVGTLYSGQPYREYSLPDVATKLIFFGDLNATLNPGMSYLALAAETNDQFGNEVSNVPVSLEATTQYEVPACGDISAHVDPIDAALFAPGQCPADAVQLTGNACATRTISVISQPRGAPFFIVPPKTSLASVGVVGATGSATASASFVTPSIYDPCISSTIDAVTLWVHEPSLGLIPLLGEYLYAPIDAAAPGEVMPVPQRVDAYHAELKSGDHGDVAWTPVDEAQFEPELTNGSLDSVHGVGGGSYLQDIRAGTTPGPIHGQIYLRWHNSRLKVPGAPHLINGSASSADDLVFGWSMALSAPSIDPVHIPLTAFGATEGSVRVQTDAQPPDYVAAPVRIDLLADDVIVQSCPAPLSAMIDMYCDLPRGWLIDPARIYTAKAILNDGTPFRRQSVATQLQFGRGVIGGYGILPSGERSASVVFDALAVLQGRFPKHIEINQSVDIASGYSCDAAAQFGYLLEQDAVVTLEFHRLDQQGNPSDIVAWSAIDHQTKTKGLQQLTVDSNDLPIGDYAYELNAISLIDGTVENYIGAASHHIERRDSLPLAHSFVKGVDLYSGGAVLSEDDIVIGGRGPGMKLSRTYASHAGDARGYFGRGWSSDLDAQVTIDACNTRIVTGSAGQGQRYVPTTTDPDGTAHFSALYGYHGILIERGGEYDFYAKDGTRHHFAQVDTAGPRISYVEDPNGNRVSFSYEVNQGSPHIVGMRDAAGRRIDLSYAVTDAESQQAGVTIHDQFTAVTDAMGPGGLHVHYEYDSDSNLARITRSDGSGGDRMQGYDYQDFGGILVGDPDGKPVYFHFGWRLRHATDLKDGATRQYAYALGWSAWLTEAGKVQYIPEQRTFSITEADQSVTSLVFPEVRGLTPVTTDVNDARGKTTHYAMNRYGAAEKILDPVSTTLTAWDMAHLQPHTTTDAHGTVTTFAYDDAGNKVSENIKHSVGELSRNWTFKPATEFMPPYVRNRVEVAVDGNGNSTTYGYDARGNRTSTKRGGVSDADSYDSNGDHSSHTDGLGNVWLFRFDANGYPRQTEDSLHHVTATNYDVRGRRVSQTDANGHPTNFAYDARDRLLTTTFPQTDAGKAVAQIAYDDATDIEIETNPLGHASSRHFDVLGRPILIAHDDGGARYLQYDAAGNLIQETDFSGNITSHSYDDANRRVEDDAPEGRITRLSYDELGHVVRETVEGNGDAARITEYAYEHPLYARTLARRLLATSGGEQWAETHTSIDNNGNTIAITDSIGRTAARIYDARDRLIEEDAPYGRVTKNIFDAADRIITKTVVNPGYDSQLTVNEYDAVGRSIAITDAVGDRRVIGYDAVGNIISRSDARGNLTRYAFDARNQLLTKAGPETGQLTTYAYDLAGNKVSETCPNGNVRLSTFDVVERPTGIRDTIGPVETLAYTRDGDVLTRTDANSHLTKNYYDRLRRLVKQDLPPTSGNARAISKTYNVHGDVIATTDPGGHRSLDEYDTLGRRVATTLPSVDGTDATLRFAYDLADRVISRTDARGNLTSIVYDDVKHDRTQTDPPTIDGTFTQTWTFDALDNEISHRDRRGILTATSYDAANRVVSLKRGDIVTSTRTYEDGRVKSDTDANGHTSINIYDRAGRRIQETRPLGFAQQWTYTPMGDVQTATDADGRTTKTTYTLRRYRDSVTNSADETTAYTYDGEGHPVTMQRPNGADYLWTYSYDEADRLTSVTDPLTAMTSFGYDLDGNQTDVTNANGHRTSYTFDARHHRRTLTYPVEGDGAATTSWTYDADGNLASNVTPNGRTRTFDIDALNRISKEYVDNPDPAEIGSTQYLHDGNGNVVELRELVGTNLRQATRTHDALDRLVTETDVHGKALLHRYDDAGNRLATTDTSDRNGPVDITIWSYNALNQATTVSVPALQSITSIDYFPSGLTAVITRPDGSTTTTSYTDAGRIDTILHSKAGNTLAREHYRYDFDGNRLEQDESNGPLTADGEKKTTYTYDKADRLVETVAPDRVSSYELDAVGNRTRETLRDAQNNRFGDSAMVYNTREQLVSRDDPAIHLHVAQAYDPDGNTLSETDQAGTRRFTWDAHDRLLALSIPQQLPLAFDYGSDGLRLAKRQGMAETRYQYDDSGLLAETNSIGNVLARYHYSATQLLSRTDVSATPNERHYLLDALHTPIATITQEGAINSRTQYGAWGEILSQQGVSGAVTSANPDGTVAELPNTDQQDIGYTGYVKDSESGLYYARARYYDPRIARFTAQDPEDGKPMQPPSLNKYLYAFGNPTTYTDPTGKYGIFFDGTGNNKDKPEFGYHTNVAKLYELYPQREAQYVPGIGTEDADGLLGSPFGYGFNRRVEQSYENLVKFYNSERAKNLREKNPEIWLQEKEIDLFGFSRGSAEARLFANVLKERGIPNDEDTFTKKIWIGYGTNLHLEIRTFKRSFTGINIRFMGLFDTVDARGDPTTSPLRRELYVDPIFVRHTTHLIAANEYRSTFDSTSALPYFGAKIPNIDEIFLPGAHSDVGGSYGPLDLEGSLNVTVRRDGLDKLPLWIMWSAARRAGATLSRPSREDSIIINPILSGDKALWSYIHDSTTEITGLFDHSRKARTIYYEDGSTLEASEYQLVHLWRSEKGIMERVKEGKDENSQWEIKP